MTKLNKEDFEPIRHHKTVREALEFFQENRRIDAYFPNGDRLALAVLDIFDVFDKRTLWTGESIRRDILDILGPELCYEDQVEKDEPAEHCECGNYLVSNEREFTVTEALTLVRDTTIEGLGLEAWCD